MTSYSKSQA